MSEAFRELRPRPYRPPARPPAARPPRRDPPKALAWGALALLLATGALLLWQSVHTVRFALEPATAAVAVAGPHLALGGRVWVWTGEHQAQAAAPGHRDLELRWRAPDADTVQARLEPLPGLLAVRTVPEVEAQLMIDGARRGALPGAVVELPTGRYALEVRAAGYEPHRTEIEVAGFGERTEVQVALKKPEAPPPPAVLALDSRPPSADLLADGEYLGRAPQRLQRPPGGAIEVVALLPGHAPARATLALESGKRMHVFEPAPRLGAVELRPVPASATVRIDGRAETRRQLRLPQTAHAIEVSAAGYVPQTLSVTPHPDAPKLVAVRLVSAARALQNKRRAKERELGLAFVDFRPRGEEFALTTTRRRLPLRLTRPFAVLDREVSNALYRRFQRAHDSGAHQNRSLDDSAQPAVRVAWHDAARFANWLSRQAGAPEFYRERDGRIEGFRAGAAGYRLPTEAEWVWLTRAPGRYAWGDDLPPPERYGNFADRSASGLVAPVLQHYDDGAPVSAAVGSYRADARGLYDLPGNVAEWVHDVFEDSLRLEAPPEAARADPLGAAAGRLHVIRGSGWRDGAQRELSRSLRRYGRDGRDDVGFRLAYYLEPAP